MSRSRILSSIAAAGLGIVMLGACSAESLTERAATFGLEQAIEGDQDIDFDFGQDGSGGFSISTEEGDFSLNFDEDNGGIVFNTDEGDGVISFDEDGIVFNTDEGDGVISFDQDNGSINFDTDEGDGAINFDDNGGVSIETEDGSLGIFNSPDAPPTWPAQIAPPATLVPGSQSYSVLELGESIVTTGVFNHDPSEPYGQNVVDILKALGWTESITSNEGGSLFVQLENGAGIVAQVIGDDTGYTTVNLTQTM